MSLKEKDIARRRSLS